MTFVNLMTRMPNDYYQSVVLFILDCETNDCVILAEFRSQIRLLVICKQMPDPKGMGFYG